MGSAAGPLAPHLVLLKALSLYTCCTVCRDIFEYWASPLVNWVLVRKLVLACNLGKVPWFLLGKLPSTFSSSILNFFWLNDLNNSFVGCPFILLLRILCYCAPKNNSVNQASLAAPPTSLLITIIVSMLHLQLSTSTWLLFWDIINHNITNNPSFITTSLAISSVLQDAGVPLLNVSIMIVSSYYPLLSFPTPTSWFRFFLSVFIFIILNNI